MDDTIEKHAEKAFLNKEAIITCRRNLQKNFLHLGYLFKVNRDDALYKLLGFDSFEAFLGDPDISFRRSKVYGLIRIFELFLDHLGREEEELIEVGTAKLLDIASVVEENPDEWLSKAAALSRSDLKNEVRAAQGRPEVALTPRLSPPLSHILEPSVDYRELVRSSPCCCCGKGPSEYSHFPLTEKREWEMGIPLCRQCHMDFHSDPKAWTWEYRRKWGTWFWDLVSTRLDREG